MSIRLILRRAAVVTAFTTLASGLPAHAASTPDYPHRAALAARWQTTQLTSGRIHNGQYDFDDWGLTVDTGLTLAAAGTHPVALKRLERAVRRHYRDYTGERGAKSAGAVAKTLVLARVLRDEPHHFGRADVRAQLLHLMKRSGADRGRFSDSGRTDYSNVIGQSYAVIGLARTGRLPEAAVNFLLKQRCPAGFFRLSPVTGKTCRRSGSAPDVDATALAVQALVTARQHGAALPRSSIRVSAHWLLSVQRKNGSFGGGLTTANSNSNSTGLAANALAATDHRRARLRAAAWVASLQIIGAKAGHGPARTDIGAIAYRPAALHRALRHGIGRTKRDQFRRATPQAYFALAPAPLDSLVGPR